MNRINILFLGGAKRVSLAHYFIEAGKLLGYDVHIFSYELSAKVPISIKAKVILGLKWHDIDLYDHLISTIRENLIHIVIPFVDPATVIASKLIDLCDLNKLDVFIPVSGTNSCELFFNKLNTEKWCLENHIQYPKSTGIFPLIAQPVEGSASKGIKIIENESDLSGITGNNNYVIQKFIIGEEYTIDIYVSLRDKKIKTIVPRIRLETQGGESIKSVTVKDKEIIEFAKTIIMKTELLGPLTLQILKERTSGKLFFMEMNPRFGGAVITSIGAGANIPLMLLKDYLGNPLQEFFNWKAGMMMIRYFNEIFIYADNN